jgi:hypothetical protein
MVQVQRQQGLPPVFTTTTGVTFHGRVLYPPGKWGRRRPVYPATVEVYRSSHVIPLWDTAETAIDGTFATKQSLTTGTADVFLKIRDAITTDRFEIDLAPSAAPGANRPQLSAYAATNPVQPAEIVVPWNPQRLPTVGCLDGRFFSDVHGFAKALVAHLRRRTLPTTVAALWLAAGPGDSKFSRGETVLRGLTRTGLPAAFPGRLTKKPGAYIYAKSMTEAAIGILERIAAGSSYQIEDSILLRPLLNAAAAALDTYVDWDQRSPSAPFADTAAVCVLHYVAAYMADSGSKTSVRIGSYDPGFPPAWHFRTVAFALGR